MKGFDKFGVQELTRLEQREILGGIGFFRGAGRRVGRALRMIVDWFEEVGEHIRDGSPVCWSDVPPH